jgi:CRP-like cAMP-binding protein
VQAATDVKLFALDRHDFLQAVTGSRRSLLAADRAIERHLGQLGTPQD